MSSEFDRIVGSCAKEGQPYLEVIQSSFRCTLIVEKLEPTVFRDANDTDIVTMLQESYFKELLVEAGTRRSFERVREYIVVRLSNALTRPPRQKAMSGLEVPFHWEYVGSAVDGLYEYLIQCEAKLKRTRSYQGRFIGIVQSSGAGKSRTVIELLKRVPGVYMNLRSAKLAGAYPLRDKVPADILGDVSGSREEYSRRCVAFFTALFRQIRKDVESIRTDSPFMDGSKALCELGSVARRRFFGGLKAEYEAALAAIPLDDPSELAGQVAMLHACADLVRAYPASSVRPPGPELVVAFDSVRVLGRQGEFRPSEVLREVLGKLANVPVSVWFLFISSGEGAGDFSSLARVHPVDDDSDSDSDDERPIQFAKKLFPPYSQFGWDQFAPRLGKVSPREVAQFRHIVGFGRVLWMSLVPSLITAENILSLAGQKLCNSLSFNGIQTAEAIAILSQRFSLDIRFGHFKAAQFQRKAISSHLAVCLDTTEDGTWQTTLYPSEPILSCAAADLLHSDERTLVSSLGTLESAARDGLVDLDKNGDLVSRLLFLLAKDLCVRSPALQRAFNAPMTNVQTQEIGDCKPLSVVAYLDFLFGEDVLDSYLKTMFENWYINFSHWVCMDEGIGELGSGAETWLTRLWYRTCAVQSSPGQGSTHKVIPMHRLSNGGPGRPSYILITHSTSVESPIPNIGKPYIIISVDLRETIKPRLVQLVNDTPTPYLRIYAPGISTTTYQFLGEGGLSVGHALRGLLALPGPKDREDAASLLKRQVRFGATSGNDHMIWEEDR